MFTLSRFFGKRSATRRRGSTHARANRKTGRSALVLENLEARTTPTASVFTDLADYAPGETALITAQGFAPGSTLELQVIHVSGMGDDGIYGTPDDVPGNNTGKGHEPWRITDGGAGDLDRVANGVILTTWYVNPDDSYLERFLLTAKGTGGDKIFGTGDDEFASHTFTDATGITNKVYQHWADAGAGDWNNNILNDQKSNYFEGEVVPHVFIYKASNTKPLVNGQSYSFDITYNYYEQNTNSGGFAYITTFNKDRMPGALGATNPYIVPTTEGVRRLAEHPPWAGPGW